MKTNYLLLCFVLLASTAFSQNFQYANVKVTSVSFVGKTQTIKKDDGTGSYVKPHWTATSADKSPVAYVSGTAPSVLASFTLSCANVPAFVYIRGEASDSITFAPQKITLGAPTGSTYKLEYSETAGSHVFEQNIVRFFKPFVINWQISYDGTTFRNIGETKNTLYVVYKTPQAEAGEFGWFHTVYDLSCRNAYSFSSEKDIISGIWREFTDQIVLNYKDDSLFYYKDLKTVNTTLAALLKYRDAECYTFAQLFLAAIKIQGIVRTQNYVNIVPNGSACGNRIGNFFVKNYALNTPMKSPPCPSFPYSSSSGVKKMPGIPGSCTTTPAASFGNHQVAKIDGVYYDPSYGSSCTTLTELRDNSLSAWGFITMAGSSIYWSMTKDVSLCSFKETITTY